MNNTQEETPLDNKKSTLEYNPKQNYGTIIEFGEAPFKFEKKVNENDPDSYYMKIRMAESNEEKVLWGIDLKRNIAEQKLEPGMFIRNEFLGKNPVNVPVTHEVDGKKETEYITTHRNTFETIPFDPKEYERIKQEHLGKVQQKSTPTTKQNSSKKTKEQNADNISPIPLELKGVRLSNEQREKLANGQTIMLKGMLDQYGIKKDGTVKMVEDIEGNKTTQVEYTRNTNLIIEDKILKYKLSKEEKKRLEKGEALGPLELDKDFKAFLQVDRTLNKVVVRTEKEMGIPQKLGGYELSDDDKYMLANGKEMLPRIFKGKHGYFIANVKMTEEKNGLEYSNIVGLKNAEAEKSIPITNKAEYSSILSLNSIVDITKSADVEQKNDITEQEDKKVFIGDTELHQKLTNAIKKGNVQEVGEVLSKSFKPTEEHTSLVKTMQKEGSEVHTQITAMLKTNISTQKEAGISM